MIRRLRTGLTDQAPADPAQERGNEVHAAEIDDSRRDDSDRRGSVWTGIGQVDQRAPHSIGSSPLNQNWLGRNADGPAKIVAAVPFLMILTPALLFMGLRRPRPRCAGLFRQPGMAACCAAAMPSALALLQVFYLDWCGRHGSLCRRERLLWDRSFDAGLWVLAAWLPLALSGRRSSGRSEIDWLGRLVGAGWLSILTVQILGRI